LPGKARPQASNASHAKRTSVSRPFTASSDARRTDLGGVPANVTALIEEADQLMTEREPVAALREWLLSFGEFLDDEHDMAAAMDTLIGGPEPIYSKTSQRLDVPIKALAVRGVAIGVFPDDIEPHDLLRALSGVAHVRPSKNWKRQTVRMVDPLLGGLQLTAQD